MIPNKIRRSGVVYTSNKVDATAARSSQNSAQYIAERNGHYGVWLAYIDEKNKKEQDTWFSFHYIDFLTSKCQDTNLCK